MQYSLSWIERNGGNFVAKDLKCYNYGNERRDYEEGKV